MKAGRLDRKVRIEANTPVDDGYNTVEGWSMLAEVACQYIPSAGKEARELLGQQATMPATFIVRYSSTLKPLLDDTEGFRIRFPAADDGQVYDVKSAVNPDRRESIHLTALAAQGDAA